MGDINKIHEDSAMHILNDLARGQQQLAQLMTQLITSTQENQNYVGNNGVGGSNGNNGNHVEGNTNNIPTQNHTRTTSRVIPRPILPHFLGEQQTGNQEQPGQGKYFSDYLREYRALGDECQEVMSLQDYCTIKYRNIPKYFNRG
jgi:hypothetical protein